jgi:hypothetical protein
LVRQNATFFAAPAKLNPSNLAKFASVRTG